MDTELFISTKPIKTDDRFAVRIGASARAARPAPSSALLPSFDATVQIGALRREWPACLADVQEMARSQAFPRHFAARNDAENVLSPAKEKMSVDSDRHSTCFFEVEETPPNTIQPSSKDEGMAAHGAPSVPSQPMGEPDFRDLARFEWRVRQPTRRDSQCVPI